MSKGGHSVLDIQKDRTFIISIVLNAIFVVVEIIYGIKANSIALVADAFHNVSDILSLVISWLAIILARIKPSHKFTYGFKNITIIVAFINTFWLLILCGGIGWESMERFHSVREVDVKTVMIIASIGVLINGITALLFLLENQEDINIRGTFLHLASDAGLSFGVLVSSIIISYTSWNWLDPLMCLFIIMIIILTTWGVFKESIKLVLFGVPKNIDFMKVKSYLQSLKGVTSIHDLHIWALSTTDIALSAHIFMQKGHPGDEFLRKISKHVKKHFNISHITIQIETSGLDVEEKFHCHSIN
jgi:cobalt-zinc-cadmium efflux system protein